MSLCILLVEDNADTRFLLRYLLTEAGHRVAEAASRQAAEAEWKRARPDVLLSDIGLPDGTAHEMMATFRAQGDPLPYAIAMSGYGTAADIEASLAAGFRHHLVKPIEIEALEALLQDAQLLLQRDGRDDTGGGQTGAAAAGP